MRFIFLGPPGAGKSTQAKALADRWQISHISTGEMMRRAIAGKTSLSLKAKAYVESIVGVVPYEKFRDALEQHL